MSVSGDCIKLERVLERVVRWDVRMPCDRGRVRATIVNISNLISQVVNITCCMGSLLMITVVTVERWLKIFKDFASIKYADNYN